MALRIATRMSPLLEMARPSAGFRRIAPIVLLVAITVFATRVVNGVNDKSDSDGKSQHNSPAVDRFFEESMLVSLYDADRVHFLLREFCKEKNLTLEYCGCMTQSENRRGIQLEAPGAATLWLIKGTARREVMCRLVAAHRSESGDGWRLKIGKSALAIVIIDPDRFEVGKETTIIGQMTVGKFFDEFCLFAEQRMKAYHHGMLWLPVE